MFGYLFEAGVWYVVLVELEQKSLEVVFDLFSWTKLQMLKRMCLHVAMNGFLTF